MSFDHLFIRDVEGERRIDASELPLRVGTGTDCQLRLPGPGGGPDVRVFNGETLDNIANFLAYDLGFLGGVFVAAGDLTGNGKPEIITGAGEGGGPNVRVFVVSLQPERFW